MQASSQTERFSNLYNIDQGSVCIPDVVWCLVLTLGDILQHGNPSENLNISYEGFSAEDIQTNSVDPQNEASGLSNLNINVSKLTPGIGWTPGSLRTQAEIMAHSRTRRKRRRPARYRDELPAPGFHVALEPSGPVSPNPAGTFKARDPFRTVLNAFGIYRIYPLGQPSDWDAPKRLEESLHDNFPAADAEASQVDVLGFCGDDLEHTETVERVVRQILGGFQNESQLRLFALWTQSTEPSSNMLQTLVDKVLKAPDFSIAHLDQFNAKSLWRIEDISKPDWASGEQVHTTEVFVTIAGAKGRSKKISCGLLHYVDLADRVIDDHTKSAVAPFLHYDFFEEYWHSPDSPEDSNLDQRIRRELYQCDRALSEAKRVDSIPRRPGEENIPYRLAPSVLHSDAAKCALFGTASVTPFNQAPGGCPMSLRTSPHSRATRPLAMLLKVHSI